MADPHEDRPVLTLDSDGLLWLGTRWVSIPDAQLPVLRLLLEGSGRVVRIEVVTAACAELGYATSDASIRSLLHRLRLRLAPFGVVIERVRGQGVVLRMGPHDPG